LYQFFTEDEWSWSWRERIDIRSHPPGAATPGELAQAAAQEARQANPKARLALFNDPEGRMAMLDFVTWSPKVPNTVEFDACKFVRNAQDQGITQFCYVRRISTKDRDRQAVAAEVNEVRRQVIEALTALQLP
jgi:hypothetical protein